MSCAGTGRMRSVRSTALHPRSSPRPANIFAQQLRHVEVALADGRQFLMGDKFTSADILLTTCLDWAIAYGVGICDNAQPYLERIQARAGLSARQEGERPAGADRSGAAESLTSDLQTATRIDFSLIILSMAPSS